jgi:DNA replication and repair protein RecF
VQYEPILKEALTNFLNIGEISLRFKPGFDTELGLKATLDNYLAKDLAWGYTTKGPHRADFEFMIDEVPAKTLFSRGQLKLFISGLILARSKWFYQTLGRHCIVLIDDLSSELDLQASRLLVGGLDALGTQVLATVLDKTQLEGFLEGRELKMFHVEQGRVGV